MTFHNFVEHLAEAVAATGATLAFDTGSGGSLAGHRPDDIPADLRPALGYQRFPALIDALAG